MDNRESSREPNSKRSNDSIIAFDTVYTTNEIQMMKIAMPLLSHDLQLLLATYIKVRELSLCYQMLQHTKLHHFSIETAGLHRFFKEAKPYCNKQQSQMFDMFENLSRTMQILDKMKLLGDDIPFDGNMDLSALMQLMPLFQSFQEDTVHETGADEKRSDHTASESTSCKAASSDPAGYAQASGDDTLQEHTHPSPMSALSPLLQNALTNEQREMYEQFQKKFSSM